MTDPAQHWNERYAKEEYAYGEAPNEFLKEQLLRLTPGRILFPAEGEGRNAVYAATLGWTVEAFDISAEGKKKAERLADKNSVVIDYRIGTLDQMNFKENGFDAIALIYAHFPAGLRADLHKRLTTLLRPGGTLILEGFSKNHGEYQKKNSGIGGPPDPAMRFDKDEIENDFKDMEILLSEQCEAELNEGFGHRGTGSVIRFVARKV